MPEQSGQIVADKYQLVRRLARGGMGAVWRARHLELDVEIALKFPRGDAELGERAQRRFRSEARAAAMLKSAHVVHIYDYGVHEGSGYIAMELLEGEDLAARLVREDVLTPEVAVDLLLQAARGVEAAHQRGLVHRDIKPQNLFLARDGHGLTVKVLDFGIAKIHEDHGGETTQSGMVFGSPSYMSPEQARGADVDVRTDIWALGAVLYRMLTGKLPFEGANPHDIVVKLCTENVPPATSVRPELASAWDGFFRRVMARERQRRPGSIAELRELLESMPGFVSLARISHLHHHSLPTSRVAGRETETAALSAVDAAVGASTDFSKEREAEPERAEEPKTVRTLITSVSASPAGRGSWMSWTTAALVAGVLLWFLADSLLPSRPAPGEKAHVAERDTYPGEPARAAQRPTRPVAARAAPVPAHEPAAPAPSPTGASTTLTVPGEPRPESAHPLPVRATLPKKPPSPVTTTAQGGQVGPQWQLGVPPEGDPPQRGATDPSSSSLHEEPAIGDASPPRDPIFGLPLGER